MTENTTAQGRSLPKRIAVGFAMFWYDFLVGDTPELFIGTLVTLGLVALISVVGHFHAVGAIVLVVMVVLMLFATVMRAARPKRSS